MKGIERRIGRFGLVGLMGAFLQILLISFLTKRLGVGSPAATAIAVEITILHNFIWHQRFTWSERGAANLRQATARLARFHAGNGLVSLVGNTVLMYCLVQKLKAPVVPTAVGGIVVFSAANFLLADRWVYANPPERLVAKRATASRRRELCRAGRR
jgi:putative flippase GtrA